MLKLSIEWVHVRIICHLYSDLYPFDFKQNKYLAANMGSLTRILTDIIQTEYASQVFPPNPLLSFFKFYNGYIDKNNN